MHIFCLKSDCEMTVVSVMAFTATFFSILKTSGRKQLSSLLHSLHARAGVWAAKTVDKACNCERICTLQRANPAETYVVAQKMCTFSFPFRTSQSVEDNVCKVKNRQITFVLVEMYLQREGIYFLELYGVSLLFLTSWTYLSVLPITCMAFLHMDFLKFCLLFCVALFSLKRSCFIFI